MKKTTILLASFLVLIIITGCQAATPALSVKEKIENSANYSPVANKKEKAEIVPVCDDFTKAYADKVIAGDVKRVYVYESKEKIYDLVVYSVPSYDLTEADFEKISKCGELGSMVPLKLISGNIIFGYPHCSGGAAPNAEDSDYADFKACTEVENQLAAYLKK